MQKITLVLVISLLQVFHLSAQKKSIVASASMMADMAENIVGDLAEVKYIVPRGQDPHLYKPTPSDVIMVQKADLIVVNGLTFEGWITKLIANSGTNGETVTITEGIDAIQSEKYANSFDPHAWMDVSLALVYIENIKNALIRLMPEHRPTLIANHDKYANQIKDLDAFIMNEIQKIPQQQRILITSHDAFAYYGKRYGLQLEAIVGISTEAEVQSSDIIRVHKVIKERKVPAIFMESTINPKILQQIAKDNKIVIGGELFADSLGEPGSPADTYLKMLEHNTITIVKSLTGSIPSNNDLDQSENPNSFLVYLMLFLGFGILLFLVVRRLNKL